MNAIQRASESRRILRERLETIEKKVSLLEIALKSLNLDVQSGGYPEEQEQA